MRFIRILAGMSADVAFDLKVFSYKYLNVRFYINYCRYQASSFSKFLIGNVSKKWEKFINSSRI